jgi:PncC family amidohydrolase
MQPQDLHNALIRAKKTLALAESCTGGAIAAKITAMPGASEYFLGSIVAYSQAMKTEFLGVKANHAVSSQAVTEMVEGLFARTSCDLAAAVSGIAGPTGKPLGSVCIAYGKRGEKIHVHHLQADPPRANVIEKATNTTLQLLYDLSTH